MGEQNSRHKPLYEKFTVDLGAVIH